MTFAWQRTYDEIHVRCKLLVETTTKEGLYNRVYAIGSMQWVSAVSVPKTLILTFEGARSLIAFGINKLGRSSFWNVYGYI